MLVITIISRAPALTWSPPGGAFVGMLLPTLALPIVTGLRNFSGSLVRSFGRIVCTSKRLGYRGGSGDSRGGL